MKGYWRQGVHLLELARIELVFASVSHAWLVLFFSMELEPASRVNPTLLSGSGVAPWLSAWLAAAAAAGLAIYGIALNDILDVRRDRAFAPNRPLAAGRIALPAAVIVCVSALLTALAASVVLGRGSILLALCVAAAILFYNATGKHLPAVAAITLGLIHAGAALVPNPTLGFAWPIVLLLTHMMLWAVVSYRLDGKRPRMTTRDVASAVAGWAFLSLLLVAYMTQRQALELPGAEGIWTGPIAALGVYVVGWAWILRVMRAKQAALAGSPKRLRRLVAEAYTRWALICAILIDAGWLAGAGMWWPAALVLKLSLVAWILRRLLTLLGHLAEPPPGYRLEATKTS